MQGFAKYLAPIPGSEGSWKMAPRQRVPGWCSEHCKSWVAGVEGMSKEAGGRRGVREEMDNMWPWVGLICKVHVTSGVLFKD